MHIAFLESQPKMNWMHRILPCESTALSSALDTYKLACMPVCLDCEGIGLTCKCRTSCEAKRLSSSGLSGPGITKVVYNVLMSEQQ